MSKSGFGEHLKREREMRGVSLDEICAATRIGTRFLEALENEEWDRLPGGVFNRGFVRAVARFLGLDEDGLVAECALAMGQSGAAASASGGQAVARRAPPADSRGNGLTWLGLLAALLLVAAAGWLGWRWYAARRAQRSSEPRVAVAPPVPPAPSADSGLVETTASPGEGPAQGGPADGAAPANGMLGLKIEAGKATALTVTADGVKVFDGSVIAGQSRSFEARAEFKVAVQDAGAILLQLNGQTLPPAGPPGRPGNVTLTQRDLKTAGGTN